jgi:hypothetical protein
MIGCWWMGKFQRKFNSRGNVIVQIFSEEGRNRYDLERKFCFDKIPKFE